jgi:hypothetical protein
MTSRERAKRVVCVPMARTMSNAAMTHSGRKALARAERNQKIN